MASASAAVENGFRRSDSSGASAEGYAADFVVLDRDPFAGAAFVATQVMQTWIDGERAFSR